MSNVALITASTSCLPQAILDRYAIHLLPFVIKFLDGNEREGAGLDLVEFYQRLEGSATVPTTAPTSVPQFIHLFESEYPEADTLVVFHVGAQVSRAYANAVQAATHVHTRRIINIDTATYAMGCGLQLVAAAEALEQGASVDAMVALVEQLRPNTQAFSLPASIKYLKMSGRVGWFPALAASMMGLQPILLLGSAGLEPVEKVRSSEAGQEALVRLVRTFAADRPLRSLGITHTNAPALAERLAERVRAAFPTTPLLVNETGPILAVHVGPGALGLAVLREP